jgi:cysteinyl-tRNA synthetase
LRLLSILSKYSTSIEYSDERMKEIQHIERRFKDLLFTKLPPEWTSTSHVDNETLIYIEKLYDMKKKYELHLLNDFDTASALHLLLQSVHELHLWNEHHQNNPIVHILTNDFLHHSFLDLGLHFPSPESIQVSFHYQLLNME